MRIGEPIPSRGWHATLALGYRKRAGRTVLAQRRHDGPLVVQKPLYPEGDAVCHTIVVHPPAGIAGGDELRVDLRAAEQAHVLVTTPGAGKWYRSASPWASQKVALHAGPGATIEWFPQEAIVFNGALARTDLDVDLQADAVYLGWDIVCLGRTGSGERFDRGTLRTATTLRRDGRLVWLERGTIDGGGALLDSPAGLAGHSVFGTMLASGPALARAMLAACRECRPISGEGALTMLPGVLAARYLGDSTEAARAYFADLWRVMRPALLGRDVDLPRIWRT